MKVMIIDDSLTIRSRIVKILLYLPEIESILQCKGIQEARESQLQFRPDVIITEFFLLTPEAIQFFQDLKAKWPGVKLIVLTDDMYEPFRQKCQQAGADRVLHKLHDFEKLPAALGNTDLTDTTARQILAG